MSRTASGVRRVGSVSADDVVVVPDVLTLAGWTYNPAALVARVGEDRVNQFG
jgi:hypothetical protein